MSYMAGMAKRLMQQASPMLYDQDLELIVVTLGGRDRNGDATERTITTIWEGKGALLPNLPRYERNAVASPVLGVEERRVVYYGYVPADAPVKTPGMALRYNGDVYELIKDPLPTGGEQGTGGNPAGWRLDLGSPLHP